MGADVGEPVGIGVNEEVGTMLLVNRIEISGDDVAKFSVEGAQLETTTIRRVKVKR